MLLADLRSDEGISDAAYTLAVQRVTWLLRLAVPMILAYSTGGLE